LSVPGGGAVGVEGAAPVGVVGFLCFFFLWWWCLWWCADFL
jgi:hypothetical protein